MQKSKQRAFITNKTVAGGIVEGNAVRSGHGDSERLDKQTVLLLVIQGLFAVANALSGTFINVYLWKAKSDFLVIGWFALSQQVASALGMWAIAKWVKEHNKMNCLRLGVALSALFYLSVLFFGKRAAVYIVPLGALQGLAFTFFWVAFNVVYFEATGPGNRDRFNGWSGLLGSLASMIAPWVSGFLIARTGNTTGYRVIFTMSLVTFIVAVIFSFFLKKRPVQDRFEWLHAFRQLGKRDSPWRHVFPALVAQGVREGVFTFLIGLMVYLATKKELQLGNYSLLTSAVSLLAYYFAGRWMKPSLRSRSMLIGALAITAAILPFFIKINFTTLLIFGISVALFYPLYGIPITSASFDAIGRTKESAEHRVEYVIFRETGLNIGRIFGTVMFIAVVATTKSPLAMAGLMLAIGSSPIVSWLFLRKQLVRPLQPEGVPPAKDRDQGAVR